MMISQMGKGPRIIILLFASLAWAGCGQSPTASFEPIPPVQTATHPVENPNGTSSSADEESPANHQVSPETTDGEKPADRSSRRILIDASRDGGVWWFPQADNFDPNSTHQGKGLANYLRSQEFEVEELPRSTRITDALLNQYGVVIRAGVFGSYLDSELQAYERFLARETTLILLSEFHRPGYRDDLAECLGISFVGLTEGRITEFSPHPITDGMESLYYAVGSAVLDTYSNPSIEILAKLPDTDFVDLNGNRIREEEEPIGAAVMGILHHPTARIFFMGDLNTIEWMPQPFVDNLIAWAFE